MLQRAVRLPDVAGVRLHVDPWLAPLVVIAIWFLARGFLPRVGPVVGVSLAVVVVGGLIASVLAHELAHALEARHRGVAVEGITLMPLGGATALATTERDARTDLAVAVVGPWTSLVAAATFGLVATAANQTLPPVIAWPVATAAGMLGWANLVLAVTNLVPALPLDGGRIAAALLWRATGDRALALRLMAGAGIVLGLALVALAARTLVIGGGVVSGTILGLLGLFIADAARSELRRARQLA
jgi:Zn-dependent protease